MHVVTQNFKGQAKCSCKRVFSGPNYIKQVLAHIDPYGFNGGNRG